MPTTGPRHWLFYCLLAILIFGVWGVVGKAAAAHADGATLQVVSTAGVLPVAALLLLSRNLNTPGPAPRPRKAVGMIHGFAAGLCGGVGNLAFLIALDAKHGGQASVVQPLTGMYPLVTILLAAVVLRERLNLVQVFGIVLAAGAFFLFNIEGTTAPGQAWWKTLAQPWMAYALAALVLWGVLAVFQKISTLHVSTELSTVCFAAAFVPIAAALALLDMVQWQLPAKAWLLGVLFGVLLGVGTLVVFAAYRTGKASVVTAVYALYPAVTVCIAVPLFHEPLGWRKIAAVVLAIAAAIALSYERQPDDAGRGFEVVTKG